MDGSGREVRARMAAATHDAHAQAARDVARREAEEKAAVRIAAMQERLDHADTLIKKATDERDAALAREADLKRENAEQKVEIERLKALLAEMQTQIDALNAEIARLNAEIDSLRFKIETLTAEIEALKEEIERQKRLVAGLEKEIADLKAAMAALQARLDQALHDLEARPRACRFTRVFLTLDF